MIIEIERLDYSLRIGHEIVDQTELKTFSGKRKR